jgi:actin related protein 2/3 complex subunit 5
MSTMTNYRLIDVDALDPDLAFPSGLITPQFPPVPLAEIQACSYHCRQLLQRGDQEGALRDALENVPYGSDEQGKVYNTWEVIQPRA